MDSNKIYKYEEGTNLDYQHYTLNHNILAIEQSIHFNRWFTKSIEHKIFG